MVSPWPPSWAPTPPAQLSPLGNSSLAPPARVRVERGNWVNLALLSAQVSRALQERSTAKIFHSKSQLFAAFPHKFTEPRGLFACISNATSPKITVDWSSPVPHFCTSKATHFEGGFVRRQPTFRRGNVFNPATALGGRAGGASLAWGTATRPSKTGIEQSVGTHAARVTRAANLET